MPVGSPTSATAGVGAAAAAGSGGGGKAAGSVATAAVSAPKEKKERRKAKRKKTWEQLSPRLTASQLSLIVSGLLVLVNSHERARRVLVCRGFFAWKGFLRRQQQQDSMLGRSSFGAGVGAGAPDSAASSRQGLDQAGEHSHANPDTARADVLSLFAENFALLQETEHVTHLLHQREREIHATGAWVVMRRFVKDRMLARIQRAFTRWSLFAKMGNDGAMKIKEAEIALNERQAQKKKTAETFTEFKHLRQVLLVGLFHLKWRTNTLLALLQSERSSREHYLRVVWNDLVTLKRGAEKADELEIAAAGVAEQSGERLANDVMRVWLGMKDLKSVTIKGRPRRNRHPKNQNQRHHHHQHQHHNHLHPHHNHPHNHHHHHHQHHHVTTKSSPSSSRSPSPTQRGARASPSPLGRAASPPRISLARPTHSSPPVAVTPAPVFKFSRSSVAGSGLSSSSSRVSVSFSGVRPVTTSAPSRRASVVTPRSASSASAAGPATPGGSARGSVTRVPVTLARSGSIKK